MSPTNQRMQRLSPEEEAALPAIRDKWLSIGLQTHEGDRQRAWEAIRRAYSAAGRAVPKLWIWMDSPLRMVYACAVLRDSAALRDQVLAQVSDQVLDQVLAQVSDQVLDQVSAQVSAQVLAQVRDQVGAQVLAQVSDQVRDQVGAQVLAQVSAQVRAQVRAQVLDQVRAQVLAQVSDQVLDQVGAQVSDQVLDQVGAQVSAQVSAQVRDQVGAQVLDQVRAQVSEIAWWGWWYQPGQFDCYWLSFYDALRKYCDPTRLDNLIAVAESCAIAWTFPDFVMFCAPPANIDRDDSGRLHSEHRAAVGFRDGWGVYAWHGLRVPADIIEHPETITLAQIKSCTNQELRRVMIERYGQSRYLLDSGAELVSQDECGALYRSEIEGDEPLVMVRVLNSTPEPDGSLTRDEAMQAFPGVKVASGDLRGGEVEMVGIDQLPEDSRFKSYFLRVPPAIETAREAVAWTFDVPAAKYHPSVQT